MSDAVVAAPSPVAQTASPKKTKAPKAKVPKVKTVSTHPPYLNMIKAAIKTLKDRKGASKQAILKHISQNYKLGDNVVSINVHLRTALKKGVTSGALLQAAGSGANGRFKVSGPKPSADGEKKKVVKKAASKPKKVAAPAAAAAAADATTTAAATTATAATGAKKAAAKPKKVVAKKPKAEKKAKSPKKTITPKVKKVAKSPVKKVTKPAAKKVATKKAAPKAKTAPAS